MAQALFDEHPLEKYLREAGETSEMMPGISSELELEIDTMRDFYANSAEDEEGNEDMEWCPRVVLNLVEILQNAISSTQLPNSPNPAVEHFKYNVISSSLLASSLPSPQSPKRRSMSASIPGKLSHSRTSSTESDKPDNSTYVAPAEPHYGIISLSALSFAASFSAGYPFLAIISFIVTLILMYNFIVMTETPKDDMTPSLEALDDLLAASSVWESVVREAISALETEEQRTTLYSPATPSLSSSSLRVALHSTLQTTHTQCDNIRQLFSALTSPSELSQLSEMYAPPSPVRSSSSLVNSSSRPFSFPSRHRVNSVPTPLENKRSTWNGSYSGLAFAGSPTNNVFRRREKHRSNLSALFPSSSASAPATPIPSSPGSQLAKVTEDDGVDEEDNNSTCSFKETRPFGAAALDLQRKNRNGGMEAFQMPPENYFTSDLRSPRSKRLSSSTSSGSRFTTLQTTRHPLSLSALHNALQGALASKRYACSHLLALRFSGDEDEGYWEDVRSVMGLLTSTFADASLRLSEALEELESEMLREQNPTPGPESSFENDAYHVRIGSIGEGQNAKRRQSEESISFAPMPSHISRFAAHVAAISSALDDARDHLEQCVAALKEDPTSTASVRSLRHSRSLNHLVEDSAVEEPPALQAYERLRRELGLALRECERGRGKLLDLVNPPIPSDEGDDSDSVPGLGHDVSDDSDKQDLASPSEDEGDPVPNAGLTVVNPDSGEAALDDATQHLLLGTSTQHLPLPGVEQVFEADTGGGVVFSRERSKLTREERIKIAKARRESGGGGIGLGFSTDFSAAEKRGIEKWGPGGEVVQELKDVIWKVGEQRRKMADSQPPAES